MTGGPATGPGRPDTLRTAPVPPRATPSIKDGGAWPVPPDEAPDLRGVRPRMRELFPGSDARAHTLSAISNFLRKKLCPPSSR